MNGTFNKNMRTGEWIAFYKTGEPKSKGSFDLEGKKIGKWINWDQKGKKKKTKY